jgi:hypothetical protein
MLHPAEIFRTGVDPSNLLPRTVGGGGDFFPLRFIFSVKAGNKKRD